MIFIKAKLSELFLFYGIIMRILKNNMYFLKKILMAFILSTFIILNPIFYNLTFSENSNPSSKSKDTSSYLCNWDKASECTYNLNDIFWSQKWSSPNTTIQGIISNIIKFITVSAWWLAILCIIIWWYIVMIPWDEKRVSKWKSIIIDSIIWIMVIWSAYAIISIVQSFIYSF